MRKIKTLSAAQAARNTFVVVLVVAAALGLVVGGMQLIVRR